MPTAVAYPGVYIEELSSGVRTITGVSTSIAAFVGWAPRGATDRAELILSWSDYERKFGGLHTASLMSYAVSHFFSNGGQRAYIIRLLPADAKTAEVTLDGKLKLSARSKGQWGTSYAIVTKKRPAPDDARFQLKVMDVSASKSGVAVETFENLSMLPGDPRYVLSVLENQSVLVRAGIVGGATAPPGDTVIPGPTDPDAGAIPDAARLKNDTADKPLDPQADKDAFIGAGKLADAAGTSGIFLLDRIDLFNLLCVPGLSDPTTLGKLATFCRTRRAFLIADCAPDAKLDDFAESGPNAGLTGPDALNAAFYFPWVSAPDPLQQNRPRDYPPSGFVAGLYARTDSSRGVWKAPAGTEAGLTGVLGPRLTLTDDENGVLNPKAVNCIRSFPVFGTVLWGARTLHGNDERGSEWKYIPVRRTALFLEESLFRALKWVVFEPNDEPLWSQIRLNVGAFMHDLFRQGAFQGLTPRDAYFVKCDRESNPQNDIDRGIVNVVVGFAPLKPAEFVIIKIQQIAGQLQT